MSVETPVDPAPEGKRKAPRWMKILLVVSLMLNVVGIGAVGARAWMIHKHGPAAHGLHALGVYSFLRKLPGERRKELRAMFKDMRGELRRQGHTIVTPLKEMANALIASEFDRKRIESALATLHASHESRAATREKFVLSFVDALTPEERMILGSKILRRIERRERWHGKYKNGEKD